jgi:hypothetical protein
LFNITEYRQLQQIIKDLNILIPLLERQKEELSKFKYYASANEVFFYMNENIQMLKAQIGFYRKKLDNYRKEKIINGKD